ncbi:MAG TPA: sensor histidine kinase [Actinocrinis sp.]|nr:sensor histidine kinase [Actinocrinis sp.]
MNPVAWWHSRSRAARFDLTIRGSFYANYVLLPLLVILGLAPEVGAAQTWVLTLAATAYAALCVRLVHVGVSNYVGRAPRPTRLIVITGAVTVVAAAAACVAYPHPQQGQPDGPANLILLLLVLAFAAALSTAAPTMYAGAAGLVGCVALYVLDSAQKSPDPMPPTVGLASLLVVVVSGFRVSLWMLGVMWELDRSRHVQASLAVAQERLRFSRDLHDVVGRALSVVALKSELAAQLARRGREQAVEEMLEVHRIAQESLAELRAVVGGYRTADLHVELSGARSLLASAGIECRVIGDGGRLPAPVQGVFGWVVREATTNVLRHSEARSCTITLRADAAGVTLTMENDGVLAPPGAEAARARSGNGLTGLAERIADCGGSLAAGPEPGGRFCLTARLPLGAEAEPDWPAEPSPAGVSEPARSPAPLPLAAIEKSLS